MLIEIGELRDQLSLDLQKQVKEVVDAKQGHSNYYLLIFAKLDAVDRNRINTKIFTLNQDRLPEVPLIGTICVYVDNEKGEIKSMWCLPPDIPTYDIPDTANIVQEPAWDGKKVGTFLYNS